MVNIGIFNASSQFKSQLLSYNHATEFKYFCFVKKFRVIILFLYVYYCYKFQLIDAFFCWEYYLWTHWKSLSHLPRIIMSKMITPYSKLFVNEYKNRNILHINKFLPLYLFYNLTDYIQILVNNSKWKKYTKLYIKIKCWFQIVSRSF